ncbi:MAG: hypothetical protein WAX04_11640 [Oscillospiraceae bacterium]
MRQRRVGTFTLGITLILIGIMVPLILIFKEKSLVILQFAPIVLVILGVEVLIYAIKFKDDVLRYDGVSIFLVIMISIVSIGTASIAPIVSKAITNERTMQENRDKGEDAIEKALDQNVLNGTADVYRVNYNSIFWLDEYEYDNMEMGSTVYLHWESTEQMPTKDEIADKLIEFVQDVDITFSRMDIEVIYKDYVGATVNLDENDLKNITRDRVLKSIRLNDKETTNEESSNIEFMQ